MFSYLARVSFALCNHFLVWPDGSDPDDADALHTKWEEPCNKPREPNQALFGGKDERRGVVPLNQVDFVGDALHTEWEETCNEASDCPPSKQQFGEGDERRGVVPLNQVEHDGNNVKNALGEIP
jgi:hypothetical protein